jgi:phage terminase large subunit-like protein
MVEGPSGIIATQKPWNPVVYEPSKLLLTWTGTGVVGHIRSSEKPRAFRGPNIGFAWLDEAAFWNKVQECWDNIMFALRHGKPSTCMVTTTPLGTEFIKWLNEDADILIRGGSSFDNRSNLDPKFLARLKARYEGTALGDQEIYGAVLTDHAFQIFKHEWLGRTNAWQQPAYINSVVAVDPGGGDENKDKILTPGELPPETGIAAMSIDRFGNLYLRGDASTDATNFGPPVVKLANQVGATKIIAESNYGGGMVRTAIMGTPEFSAQSRLKFELVQSIGNKIDRAIPVGIRAEQGRVFHVGGQATYRDLETQLVSLDRRIPKPKKSPDRADAYVHAALYLMAWYDEKHAGGSVQPIAPANLDKLVRRLRR